MKKHKQQTETLSLEDCMGVLVLCDSYLIMLVCVILYDVLLNDCYTMYV